MATISKAPLRPAHDAGDPFRIDDARADDPGDFFRKRSGLGAFGSRMSMW